MSDNNFGPYEPQQNNYGNGQTSIYGPTQSLPQDIIKIQDNPPQMDQMDQLPQSKQPETILEQLETNSLQSNARKNFIVKVYSILVIMLLITFGFCFISYYNLNFQSFQVNNPWCFYMFLGISCAIVLVIQCCGRDFSGSNPLNLILLAIFTICYSYIISFFTSIYANAYGAPLVLEALFLTIALVLALTFYAFVARIDFSALAGVLIVVILAFILFGISFAFTLSPALHTLYMTLGIIVGGIIIVFDTIMIADGERGCSLDDPVFGALILYLDIIRIFLYILMAMGKKK